MIKMRMGEHDRADRNAAFQGEIENFLGFATWVQEQTFARLRAP